MSPNEVKGVIRSIVRAHQPVHVSLYLVGQPGIGKTAAPNQVIKEEGVKLWEFYPGTRETVDASGVPVPEKIDGAWRTVWAAPDQVPPKDWRGILLVDELPHSEPSMMRMMGRVFHERKFGDTPLPDHCLVVATGNRATDRAGANRLLTHTSNRLVILPVEVSTEDWLDWAGEDKGDGQGRVHPAVRSFIQFKSSLLNKFDPAATDQQPTPRSWAMVSDLLPYIAKGQNAEDLGKAEAREKTQMFWVVAGAVGKGAAAEFCGYCRYFLTLPDPKIILKDPEGAEVFKDPAINHSLCGTLSDFARRADNKTLDAIATYALRLPAAFGRLLAQDSLRFAPGMVNTEGGQKLIRKYRDLILKHRGQ